MVSGQIVFAADSINSSIDNKNNRSSTNKNDDDFDDHNIDDLLPFSPMKPAACVFTETHIV